MHFEFTIHWALVTSVVLYLAAGAFVATIAEMITEDRLAIGQVFGHRSDSLGLLEIAGIVVLWPLVVLLALLPRN